MQLRLTVRTGPLDLGKIARSTKVPTSQPNPESAHPSGRQHDPLSRTPDRHPRDRQQTKRDSVRIRASGPLCRQGPRRQHLVLSHRRETTRHRSVHRRQSDAQSLRALNRRHDPIRRHGPIRHRDPIHRRDPIRHRARNHRDPIQSPRDRDPLIAHERLVQQLVRIVREPANCSSKATG